MRGWRSTFLIGTLAAGLLLAATVALGLFPGLVMDYILPSARVLLETWHTGGPR